MRIASFSKISLVAALVLVPALAEASATPKLNYGRTTTSVDRPTRRSIKVTRRSVWDKQAATRHSFMAQLLRIEKKRDEIAPEWSRDPAPDYHTNVQDFTKYHWHIRQRHVRHQYWDSYFQRGTAAHTGQGMLGQPELADETHRTDIEVDSGGR